MTYWVEFQAHGDRWRVRFVNGEYHWSWFTGGAWTNVAIPSMYVRDQFMGQVIMKQAVWSNGDEDKDSPTQPGTATTHSPLVSMAGEMVPIGMAFARFSDRIASTRADLSERLDRLESDYQHRVGAQLRWNSDTNGRIRALESSEDSSDVYDRVSKELHSRLDDTDPGARLREFENEIAVRIGKLESHVEILQNSVLERLQALERKPAVSSVARESAWLYQVINPTLDAIEEALRVWAIWSGSSEPAARPRVLHNTAIMRDLTACNADMAALFAGMEYWWERPRTPDDSSRYYNEIRERLMKFSRDTCERLGIPAAPR